MSVRRSGAPAALTAAPFTAAPFAAALFAVVLFVVVLFAAGCAGNATSPGSPSASGGGASTSAEPSLEPSAGAETLTGTVEAGVEPGCLVLKGTGKDHLLLFDEQSLKSQAKVGSSITVTGSAKPAQVTTCQQGIPFIVTSVRAGS